MSPHDLLYLSALLAFLVLPVLLALKWGDRIAEAWDRRRIRNRRRRPKRIDLAKDLPGQDELLTGLSAAEERCEAIDLQISERLLDLQRLTMDAYRQRRSGAASDLLKPAGALETLTVKKESHLNLLLDVACLQSDRIDAMTASVEALSQALDWPPPSAEEASRPPEAPAPAGASPAANQLLRRIEDASRKRRSIDERLKQMRSWKPPARNPQPQPPSDPDTGQKGSRFDMTVQ